MRETLVVSWKGWVYPVGTGGDDAWRADAARQVFAMGYNPVYWFGLDDLWCPHVSGMPGWQYSEVTRNSYRYDRTKYTTLPPGRTRYRIEAITPRHVEIYPALHKVIESFWSTGDAFLESGFGCIALDDGRIAGHMIAAAVSGGEAEVDVAVDKPYQRHGLGTHLGRAFIYECLKRELLPKWDCVQSNKASVLLANKLGFVLRGIYQLAYLQKDEKQCG